MCCLKCAPVASALAVRGRARVCVCVHTYVYVYVHVRVRLCVCICVPVCLVKVCAQRLQMWFPLLIGQAQHYLVAGRQYMAADHQVVCVGNARACTCVRVSVYACVCLRACARASMRMHMCICMLSECVHTKTATVASTAYLTSSKLLGVGST